MQETETPTAAAARPRRFSWTFALTIVLSALLLFLAFRGVDWGEMLATVQQGRVEYLLLGFVLMTVSYFLRALRWRVLLSAEKRLHPVTVFWGTCAGYLGNAFLPARAGELIRTVLIGQRAAINKAYVLATALTERVFDAALLVVIVLALLPILGVVPDWILSARPVFILIAVGGMAGLLLAPHLRGLIIGLLQRLPLPETLQSKLQELIEKFLLGMKALQHPVRAVSFVSITLVVWAVDVVIGLQIAAAFDLVLDPLQVLFLLAALGLSSAVPSTPGYVGVYQFVAVTVLGPFGVGQAQALVYILAFQAVTYALVTLWGTLGLWFLNAGSLRVGNLARTTPAAESDSG